MSKEKIAVIGQSTVGIEIVSESAVKVVFSDPINTPSGLVDMVTIRKPVGRDLGGIITSKLAEMDATTIRTIAPRITTPRLSKDDFDLMSLSDISLLGQAIAVFFIASKDRAELVADLLKATESS